MGWAANAVIGFKAANNLYQNHNLSGNSARLIACQNSAVTSWYNVLYPLRKLRYSVWSPTKLGLTTFISIVPSLQFRIACSIAIKSLLHRNAMSAIASS